jgi:hypothetical protein
MPSSKRPTPSDDPFALFGSRYSKNKNARKLLAEILVVKKMTIFGGIHKIFEEWSMRSEVGGNAPAFFNKRRLTREDNKGL